MIISTGADSPIHPSRFSTVTEYWPGVFTNMDCDVSPFDHWILIPESVDNSTESPEHSVVEPFAVICGI